MNYPGFVFRMLRDDGHSAGALLAETGLEEKNLRDPYFRSGFEPLRRFLLNAIKETGDPHLGVRLALKFQPTYIGLPSYAAMNAARFREGVEILELFFFLTFPAFELTLIEDHPALTKGEAAVRQRSKFPFGAVDYFGFGSAIVGVHHLLSAMLRTDKVAIRAEMRVEQPNGWAEIQAEFGFPFRFGCAENQIVFRAETLSQPLPGADPFNHTRLRELCEEFAKTKSSQASPVTQVVALLEGARDLTASLSDVAAELGYSERGLRRQLVRSGTSYRKVVDQVREQRARDLLAGTARPIKAVAGAVGFETSSNFARSFKRWTGLTPKAFREEALQKQALRRSQPAGLDGEG